MKYLKKALKEKLIEHAKECLKPYKIDISKYGFKASMDDDGITAYVKCWVKGHPKRIIWLPEIFFHEDTFEILQSGKLYFN